MANELEAWLKALDPRQFDVEGSSVTCWFADRDTGRKHVVRVQRHDGGLRFEATVATAKTLDRMDEDPARWAWRRNRASSLVGFRVDQKRLIAEAVAPTIGLTEAEFMVYLRAVAAEADRMELGVDRKGHPVGQAVSGTVTGRRQGGQHSVVALGGSRSLPESR